MTQSDLNRAVARLTGESVRLVRQRGFTLVNVGPEPRRERACNVQIRPQTKLQCLPVDLSSAPAA